MSLKISGNENDSHYQYHVVRGTDLANSEIVPEKFGMVLAKARVMPSKFGIVLAKMQEACRTGCVVRGADYAGEDVRQEKTLGLLGPRVTW